MSNELYLKGLLKLWLLSSTRIANREDNKNKSKVLRKRFARRNLITRANKNAVIEPGDMQSALQTHKSDGRMLLFST